MPETGLDGEKQERALQLLNQHWGYGAFRHGQWEAISSVLEGRDTLLIFPTGGGKSLCYQVPSLLVDGLTLVISPLIALMQDQVAGLRARGIPAAFINSTLSQRQIEQTWTDAEFGRYRLLYIAPERLQSDLFRARATRLRIGLLAVDEAHCVSEWGLHFRPSYLRIHEAREALGHPVTLAVTASATPEVRRDIVTHLHLRDPLVRVHGFDRPNITWSIFRTEHKRAKVKEVLEGVKGSGLVYVGTRRHAEEWAAWLMRNGIGAEAYHGGMNAEDREAVAQRWLRGERRIVVATNAFGMGIDKPDVRFVVHVDLPLSLEAYYQEAGRGGRDGKRSHAVLIVHEEDDKLPLRLIEQSHPDRKTVREVYDTACSLAQIAVGSKPDAPVPIDSARVAALLGISPVLVSSCIEVIVRQGIWQRYGEGDRRGRLRFTVAADRIRGYAAGCANTALSGFIDGILRNVDAEAFHAGVDVDPAFLAKRLRMDPARLERGLHWLSNHGFADWLSAGSASRVQFTEPRTGILRIDNEAVEKAGKRSLRRYRHMQRYARSETCRRRTIMGYFGERTPIPCGRCDVCLGRHEPLVLTPDNEQMVRRVLEGVRSGTSLDDLREEAGSDEIRFDRVLEWLERENYVTYVDLLSNQPILTDRASALLGA